MDGGSDRGESANGRHTVAHATAADTVCTRDAAVYAAEGTRVGALGQAGTAPAGFTPR